MTTENAWRGGGGEYGHFIPIIVMYCFEQHVLHSLVVRIALYDVSASSNHQSSSVKYKTQGDISGGCDLIISI